MVLGLSGGSRFAGQGRLRRSHLAIAKSTANHTPELRLLKTGFSSTEAREKLETLRPQLTPQLAQNRAQALAAVRELAVLEAQLKQNEAALAAARAALVIARLNLTYTTIIAPQDGVRETSRRSCSAFR
jgi:membrane fusion protein, multidrug efflux system